MKEIVSARGAALCALLVVGFAALVALVALPAPIASAAETIRSFEANYEVRPDGTIQVTERIVYDFGTAERHGIFRDLVDRQQCSEAAPPSDPDLVRVHPCESGFDRVFNIQVQGVTDEAGRAYQYEASREGDGLRLKIGDPDRTITGAHTYVITYQLSGALDAYPKHDELNWNATGNNWDVTIEEARFTVELPEGSGLQATCYQGEDENTDVNCTSDVSGNSVTYSSVGPIAAGDQMTIVAGWDKGLVAVAPPVLEDRASIDDFFEFDFWELGGMALTGVLAIAGVVALWWRNGRDRAYRSLYYLTNDPTEGTRPMFSKHQVVVEYTPPDDLRPAQAGVILDERADTLDVTATIVDLAVRGHLHITEIPKEGWFGKTDWQLEKRESDDPMLPYEHTLWLSLFDDGDTVKISDLKNKFYKDLKRVSDQLYDDAMQRKWFTQRPTTSSAIWVGIALAIVALGVGGVLLGALAFGRALIFAPIVLAGLLMLILAPSMKRRTAKGSEALRRVLGFRLYVVTAEKRIQEFNEQQNILNNFAKYLPYAMVFGAVDKWAKAFEGIGDEVVQSSTAGWYTGVGAFHAASFSSNLQGFSSSVSSSISSSPSSSGSGFSGGAGGGGGGGGGGSW